jgi:membrane protein DedA with SNARE-associated domain
MSALGTAVISAANIGSYAILYIGVAASWVGIPIVGAGVIAGAGVLAGEGQLDIWLVIVVAALASWTGGYGGYLLGLHARETLVGPRGRWQRQRRRAMRVGERIYRRWGPLAVFLTPAWVSGALRMPRNSFLAWNALASILSSLVAVFGAYAIATAVLGKVSTPGGEIMLAIAIAAVALTAVAVLARRHRHRKNADGRSAGADT